MSETSMVQFFDEMNLMRSEKQERLETARNIKKQMTKFFSNQLRDYKLGIFLSLKNSDEYIDDLIAMYNAFSDMNDDYIRERAKRWAVEIEQTTETAIPKNIEIGSRQKEIPLKVSDALSNDRAERIGLHESNVIHNYKRHNNLKSSQYTHTWETMKDERVRPHHVLADGQTVPIDEPFIVMGEKLMFPCDDSLGATAENICGCRCIEL